MMPVKGGKARGPFTPFKTLHEDLRSNVYKHIEMNVHLYEPSWELFTVFYREQSAVPSLAKFTVSLGCGSVAKSSFNLPVVAFRF